MKGLSLPVLLLVAGVVACDENPLSPSEIVDITWKLESVSRVGSAVVTVPNPELFTIRFEDNDRTSVRADCNSCTGGYTLDGSSLSIRQLACTLVACPTPGLDTLYTTALQNVGSVDVSEEQLVLTGSEFTLRFRK